MVEICPFRAVRYLDAWMLRRYCVACDAHVSVCTIWTGDGSVGSGRLPSGRTRGKRWESIVVSHTVMRFLGAVLDATRRCRQRASDLYRYYMDRLEAGT